MSTIPTDPEFESEAAPSTLELVNKATGEVMEFDISSPERMALTYDELTQFEAALRKAKDQLKDIVRAKMDEDDKYVINKQYEFVISSRANYVWDKGELRSWLDDDQLDTVTVVADKKITELLKDLKEAGAFSADEIKAIKKAKYADSYTPAFKLLKYF